MLRGLLMVEAINSVAIEHPESCACDICQAANGNTDALARVWAAVDDEERRRHAEEGH